MDEVWYDDLMLTLRMAYEEKYKYSNKMTFAKIDKGWGKNIELNYITWFKNEPCIDIRIWEGDKPKKGVSMTFEQFVELANNFNNVIENMRTIMEEKSNTKIKLQDIEQEFQTPSPKYIYTKSGRPIRQD